MAPSFKFVWTQIVQIRMESKAVVPHRDVLHDIGPSLRTGLIVPPMNSLRLQFPEETFNNAVIPTVAFSAHAPQNPVGLQKPSELMTRILNPTVRMKNQSILRSPVPDRHLQSIAGETGIDSVTHRPSHNLAGIKVNHDCQIDPSLMGPKSSMRRGAVDRFPTSSPR